MLGRSAPYAEGLLFEPPTGGTVDLDEAIIEGSLAEQMGRKAKETISGQQERPNQPRQR